MTSSRSILVLGSHRCGTSAVAGCLHLLGVDMGGSSDWRGSVADENPRGQFEDNRFVALNDRLCEWRRGSLRAQPSTAAISEMRTLVAEREAASPLWGVKDPRFCFTAPYFLDAASDPKIVLVTRDIKAATASLQKRNGLSVSLNTQARHYAAAFEAIAAFQTTPLLHIDYGRLCDKPHAEVARLAAFVDVSVTPEALAHVDPTLRHWT